MKTIIKLYNTNSKKVEEFKPIEDKKVGMYSCGPTVYDVAHIGNLRAYVFVDVLYRFLKSQGYEVKWVMNITDIDDKTLKKAREENKPVKEITDKYYKIFLDDLESLNININDIKFVRATEHFSEMKELVDQLLEKGYAYKAEDGIYFDISKFKDYGKFADLNIAEDNSRSRIDTDAYDKESVKDFALWKKDPDYPEGRPGWHIECSAMAAKYLGLPFDIHTGGVDLIFPHHTNEIAQTKAATGKDLAKFWLHNEHLLVEGRKMAKSEGNYYTLQDVIDKGFSPMALRLELLKAHYRSKLDFSWQDMRGAQNQLNDFKRFWAKSLISKSNKDLDAQFEEFIAALSDDLNVPDALSVIYKVIKNDENAGSSGIDFIKKVDEILGLKIAFEVPDEITQNIKEMDAARDSGKFEESDRLRQEIEKEGYTIENSADGSYAIGR